jgi:hypothetical protein
MCFLMMGRDMRAMEPSELLFWGVMSLGVIAGCALAYPANVWMVKVGLKHGLMTERKGGTKFARQKATADHSDYSGASHRQTSVEATRPQIVTLSSVSAFALGIGMVSPSNQRGHPSRFARRRQRPEDAPATDGGIRRRVGLSLQSEIRLQKARHAHRTA